MKKVVLLFCILIITARMGFAVDFTRGPDSVQPGNILISGGLAVGAASYDFTRVYFTGRPWNESGNVFLLGGTVAVDFALPFYALTVGGEISYLSGDDIFLEVSILPIMARLAIHPDFGVDNLNAYGLLKLGFGRGVNKRSVSSPSGSGFGFGLGIGGRYFFTDNLGAFAELGLDSFSYRTSEGRAEPITIETTGRRFVTIGVTYKLSL
ncbi:MAG: outer membrane beta-barrel protein [Treponema sp.]|nr:outer membrane beta-barrel protein [Treponema sp.]